MGGCCWLFLQAQEGDIHFTELAERVEYGKYVIIMITLRVRRRAATELLLLVLVVVVVVVVV